MDFDVQFKKIIKKFKYNQNKIYLYINIDVGKKYAQYHYKKFLINLFSMTNFI